MKNPVLLLCALLVALAACREPQPAPHVRSVVLTTPQPVGGAGVTTLPGVVREAHELSLSFKTAGQLARILVDEGDHVRRGQLVAVLDDADYRLGVEALQVQYDQLAGEFERLTLLYEKKSLSANDYEKARAGLRQLGVQLRAEKNRLSYTRLYAPTAGYVQSVLFDPSEMVDAGTPVVTLLADGRREVEVDLPAALYVQHSRLTDITCALPGDAEAVPMSVTGIVPKADARQQYKMYLAFTAPGGASRFTAGTNVEVAVRLSRDVGPSAFTLPLPAVFQDEGKTYVWVVGADSVVRRTPVVMGLRGGERVVRAGVDALRNGEKVRAVTYDETTNIGGLI